jgi:nucleoside-diphosphate-sugar epimerase
MSHSKDKSKGFVCTKCWQPAGSCTCPKPHRQIVNCGVSVVGGAGFLGSHLVDHLIEDRNCRVLVIDNLCVGRREFVHPKAKFEHADITHSEERLRTLFAANGIQYVFNYAAYPYVPTSYVRPLHVFEVNATGAIKVINAAQDAGACVLQVSSAELYGGRINQDGWAEGNVTKDRLSETSPVCPHSTYGVAKAAVDAYCQCAWRERGTKVIALRQFNCVGERETHPYVVPEIISQLAKQGKPDRGGIAAPGDFDPDPGTVGVVRLGNNSSRDFMYAGDAVRAALRLLECGQFGEVYNLGSETSIKIYDLAKKIGGLMGFADVRVERDEARVRPWEIWHLQSDNTKLWSLFPDGMSVQTRHQLNGGTPLDEALRRTIAWYEKAGRKWPWETLSPFAGSMPHTSVES